MLESDITGGQARDVVGNAHLSPVTDASLYYAVDKVKNTVRAFFPIVYHGFAGYTAPGAKRSINTLAASITSPGTTCSISILMRYNHASAGTIIRFEGGSTYIYSAANGDIQLEASATYTLATAAEIGINWGRLTLIRKGTSSTDVYWNNTFLRNVARTLNIATGVMTVFAYSSARTFPGGADLAGIKIYSHNLTEPEIAALVTADGPDPAKWSIENNDGSDFSGGCLYTEDQLLAGGYVGNTYYAIENIPGIGNRTKLWTNGESCRFGKCYYVRSKTKLGCLYKGYIPTGTTMSKTHSSPSLEFSLFQFQTTNNTTDIPANYIALVQAQWNDPGDGARLRTFRVYWYNAAGSQTIVPMDAVDIPIGREFTVECEIEYAGASSKIQVWLDGVRIANIENANFTGKSNIASVQFFPYNGIHLDMVDASNSYAVYLGKQYVGDERYVETSLKSRRDVNILQKTKGYIGGFR